MNNKMDSKQQIFKMGFYISLIFSLILPILNALLYGFNWHNDLIYYYNFIEVGYAMNPYQFIPVIYLPFFYFLFYPISLIPIRFVYFPLSLIITICLVKTIKLIRDMSKISSFERYFIMGLVMIDSAIESTWCNMEIICLFVYMKIMIDVMQKEEISVKQIVILAIFSFKIVSILHFFYIILFIKKDKIKSIVIYFTLIFTMCLPYLLIDINIFNIEYLIWILQHANSTIINEAIVQRNTFMIPLTFLIVKLSKTIFYKVKYRKNVIVIFK